MEMDYQQKQGCNIQGNLTPQDSQAKPLQSLYACDRSLMHPAPAHKNTTSPHLRTQDDQGTHLEFYRAIAENLPNGAALAFDHHLRYQLAAGTGLANLGLSAQSLLGQTLWDIFPPEILSSLEYACHAALHQQIHEQELTWGDRYYHVRTLPFTDDPQDSSGILMIWQDFTPHKRIEQQLRDSEERWQLAVKGSHDGIWDWNIKTHEVFFSPRWKAILGYTDSEISHRIEEWSKRLHPEDQEQVFERLQDHFDQKTPFYSSEHRLRCKDGSYKWILDRGQACWDSAGNLIRMVGSYTDIDDRKRLASELQHTQTFLKTIIDHLPVALFVKDGRPESFGQIILWNKTSESLLGVPAEQALGKTVRDFFPYEQAISFEAQDIQAFQEQGLINISEESVDSDTSGKRFLHTVKVPVYDENNHPLYLVCFSEDITDRKQAEERLNLFIQASKDGFWDWDLTTNEIYFSARWKEMLGYEDSELPNNFSSWENALFEEDRKAALQLIDDYNQGRVSQFLATQRFEHKNGSIAYILSRAIHVKNDQGQVTRMVGANTDITELKKAQEALQHSQALLAGILNSSLDGIMALKSVRDETGKIIDFQWLLVNPMAARSVHREASGLMNKQMLAEMPENLTLGLFDAYVKVVETGIPFNHELYYQDQQLQAWFQIAAVKLNDGFTVTFRDISDRKLSEINLRRQALTFENIYDGTIITDLKGCILDWNPAAERIFGYSKAEVTGQSAGILYKDSHLIVQILDELIYQERWFGEIDFIHKDGSERICEMTTVPLRDNHNQMIATISVNRDITELKYQEIERQKAANELSQQKEILQSIFDHIPIMIVFYNRQGKIQLINREVEKNLGWNLAEVQQIDIIKQCYPDPEYREKILGFRLNPDGKWKDMRMRTRDHKILETSWANIRLSNGTTIGIGQDITERKQAEEQLQQQAERERLLGVMQTRIRQSLELGKILDTAVKEVLHLLKCDRVLVVRFLANHTCQIISEAVSLSATPLLGIVFSHSCQIESLNCQTCQYLHDPIVHPSRETIAQCLEDIASQFQHKTQLVVPILQKEENWGLLIAEQNLSARQWQAWEIELLQQLAIQVGIATQQSQLYQQLQIANQELQRLATVDGLTQVANRRYFDQYLQQEWRRLMREQASISLILCDLDFFKAYNDTYGHQAGDECLKTVARMMRETMKRPADLVARYGGEEFAMILPHTPSLGAVTLAEMLRRAVQALKIPHQGSEVNLYVTLSLGVASKVPSPDQTVEDLIAEADRALYQAKALGRDRTILATDDPNAPS